MQTKTLEKDPNYLLYAWATHMPLLTYALRELKPKTILEYGTGWYSSSLINAYCVHADCTAVSYENDYAWYTQMKFLSSPRHSLIYCATEFPVIQSDLAFVDHEPEVTIRAPAMVALQDCKVVILHDSMYPHRYGFLDEIFQYKFHDGRSQFSTTAYSKTIPVNEWNL